MLLSGTIRMYLPLQRLTTIKLLMADLVVPNMEARRLQWDVQVVQDALNNLDERSYAFQTALRVANSLVNAFGNGTDEEIQVARSIAQTLLGENVDSAKVYSQNDHTVSSIGHCHIDTAWLWPYRETRRKIGRSWSTQCDLTSRYSEHRMCVSQAQQFKWLQEDYPRIWKRLLSKVEEGFFQPIGGVGYKSRAPAPSASVSSRTAAF